MYDHFYPIYIKFDLFYEEGGRFNHFKYFENHESYANELLQC